MWGTWAEYFSGKLQVSALKGILMDVQLKMHFYFWGKRIIVIYHCSPLNFKPGGHFPKIINYAATLWAGNSPSKWSHLQRVIWRLVLYIRWGFSDRITSYLPCGQTWSHKKGIAFFWFQNYRYSSYHIEWSPLPKKLIWD